MDIQKEIVEPIVKWFKDPKTIKGLAMYAAVIVLMAFNFAYWAQAVPVGAPPETGGEVEEENNTAEANYTLEKVLVADETGTAGRGSPLQRSTTTMTFDLAEGAKIVYVNLTCENPRSRTDYDLNVYYPDGKNAGSSAGPDATESVKLEAKGNKTLPSGTYEVEIVFWLMTMGTTWHVTVEAFYLVENGTCGPGGCEV
ncbi:MAG: hypothetical protein J7L61_03945 [Thermoplasmata archaeon]|nr:hypothetical protein [Thermoplasmata archaeon]